MKRTRPRNTRLSSERKRRQQFYVAGVTKRGSNATLLFLRRWTWRLMKLTFFAALGYGIYYGATEGWQRFFWKNPDYALQVVSFATDGSLTREQALAVTKLKTGGNIFSYDRSAARDALRNLPQVESAEVRRYLPNRIDINVTERKPVAWVTSNLPADPAKTPHSHLLDARGLVFQPKQTLHEYDSLPVIGGVELGDLEPGKPIRKAEVVAALELLRRVRDTGDFKIYTIDVSRGYCIVATNQKRSEFTFGLDDIDGQLRRLGEVQIETALRGQEVQTVNLMLARNVPVRFFIPPPPEPPEPTTPEPSRTPKIRDSLINRTSPSSARDKPATNPKDPPKKQKNGVLKRFTA